MIDPQRFPLYLRITATSICILLLFIGSFGNMLVPLVVLKSKELRNSTNIFLVNLSIADLFFLLTCTPTILIELHTQPETWHLGRFVCVFYTCPLVQDMKTVLSNPNSRHWPRYFDTMNIYRLLLYFLLSLYSLGLSARKVKERFNPIPSGFSLRVVLSGSPTDSTGNQEEETLTKGLNVSIVTCNQQKIGEVNETTGQYDGWIGFIQRNEADLMPQFVRPDSTPGEPGIFIPFSALDDSPRIYSYRPEMVHTFVADILYLWTNFDSNLWIYFLVSLIICSVLFVFFNCVLDTSSIREMISKFVESFWAYYILSVDMAPTVISMHKSAMILWTCIVLTIFYALHMVLMGTLSTDLTVPYTNRSIDSLDDLLHDPQFNGTIPVIFRGLNMYSVLKRAGNGTIEHELFQELIKNESYRIKEFDTREQGKFMGVVRTFFDDLMTGKIAMVENSKMITPVLMYIGCYYNETAIGAVRASREIIVPSAVCGLMSKQTPLSVRTILHYRFAMISEAGLYKGVFQSQTKSLLTSPMAMGMANMSRAGMVCEEKLGNTYTEELDLPWEPFDLKPFKRLIRILMGWMAFAFLVLIGEKLYPLYQRSKVESRVKVRNKVKSYAGYENYLKKPQSAVQVGLTVTANKTTVKSAH